MPSNISVEEAASIPFAGLTAWSALNITGELFMGSKGKKVLVLGASGGVGSIAVQLLKSWGSLVSTYQLRQLIKHSFLNLLFLV